MKTRALILGLPLLGGRGTIEDLRQGPRIYGGVRQDVDWMGQRRMAGMGLLDFPVAFALTK